MGRRRKGILFLPQEAFFVKAEEAPSGLSEADLRSYARTVLESFSPVPADGLQWGFCVSGGKILIFAASHERLAKCAGGARLMESAPLAVPFAALVWGLPLPDGWSVIRRVSRETAEYMAVDVSGGAWRDAFALSRPKSAPEGGVLAEIAGLSGCPAEAPVWDFSCEPLMFGRFEARISGENSSLFHRVGGAKFCDRADVRGERAVKAARAAAAKARALAASWCVAGAAALALAAWSVSMLFQGAEVSRLERRMADIQDDFDYVSKISADSAFLHSIISKKTSNTLMIARVNRFRPEGVTFTKTSVNSPKAIEIRGKAKSVNEVSAFEKALKAAPGVAGVKVSLSGATSSGNSWTMNVEFKD